MREMLCVHRILNVCASQLCNRPCASEPKTPVNICATVQLYVWLYHGDLSAYSLNATNGHRII